MEWTRGGGAGWLLSGLLLLSAARAGAQAAPGSQVHMAPSPAPGPARSLAQVYRVPAAGAAARYRVPQVRLPAAGAAAARRINATLARLALTDNLDDTRPAATAGQAIQRARADYEGNGQSGLFATDYKVLLNQGQLLSLALTLEYSAAYPSTDTHHATFDLRTGRLLAVADLLADTLALRQRWHQRINQRVAARLREVAQEYPADPAAPDAVRDYTQWSDSARQIPARARPALREFALTPQGLVLYTRFEFPHVVLALAPDDEYLFPYAQALPWARPQGLLRQLRR